MRMVRCLMAAGLCGLAVAACENASTVDDSYYRLQMEYDLRNLVNAQDAYFLDNTSYTTSASALKYLPSYGVTVTIGAATATGWSATSKHFDSQVICGVYAGSAATPIPGATKREPACP
jgi:hypothetical protein